MTKEYWIWYWGIDHKEITIHCPPKKFINFYKMKEYSAKHAFKHKWIENYWSNYNKIEIK